MKKIIENKLTSNIRGFEKGKSDKQTLMSISVFYRPHSVITLLLINSKMNCKAGFEKGRVDKAVINYTV